MLRIRASSCRSFAIHIEYRKEDRQDERAEDKSERAEEKYAAEDRKEDEYLGCLQTFAEVVWREHVVEQDERYHGKYRKSDSGECMPFDKKVHDRRKEDRRRTDTRYRADDAADTAPEDCIGNTKKVEADADEDPADDRDE